MSSRAINVTASSGQLFISDSVIRDGSSGGPTLDASATSASATIVRVQSLNNAGAGFNFEAGKATLRDVVVANNGGYGIHVNGGEASVTVDIDRATVRGNYTGIFVSGSGARATITASTLNQNANDGLDVSSGATAIASGNTVTWNSNGIGVYLGGGTLKSPGDNTISDNATNVQGSITSISKQ